jgi:hypothetical protein
MRACRWNLRLRLALGFHDSDMIPGEAMTEHSQLASAVLVTVFAAGILLAGQIFTLSQSARFHGTTIYVASLPP